jgi:16S rRNA (guanine(966)-N(2))-methyltransferase RsmD
MRVIAGEFRSRKLLTVPGMQTRPTPDRLRETLFSILMPIIEGTVFVDAYAGTGSVGIEAISRGARQAVFIENDRTAVEVLRSNINNLGIEERTRIVRARASASVAELTNADIVFADPPYTQEREYKALFDVLLNATPPLTIVQHSVRLVLEADHGGLRRTRMLRQGENALSFYER